MSRVTRSAVDYPYSDGRPMAESEAQLRAMVYVLTMLYMHFENRSDVYVGGDMFVYYEEGNPGAVVAPDVFVAIGAPKQEKKPRLSYKLWEEPKGPDFVLEVVSRSTWAVDRNEKPKVYARLGVEEYWLYDPTGEHDGPRLRGMRLVASDEPVRGRDQLSGEIGGPAVRRGRRRTCWAPSPATEVVSRGARGRAATRPLTGGGYRDLPPVASGFGVRKLHSAVLGLDVGVDQDGAVCLYDPETGRALPSHAMERAAREAAETRARQEAAAREVAEARIAELQALLRELQGGRTPPGDGK